MDGSAESVCHHLCSWYFQREKAMRRYVRFPDFQLWFTRYREMTLRHPSLLQLGKLRRLRDDVIKALEFG